jgi:hypothetical protein
MFRAVSHQTKHIPFVVRLRMLAERLNHADPWLQPIEHLRGPIDAQGVERLSTVAIFDAIGIPQHERTPAAAKRLKALMESCGWTAVRHVSLTPLGSRSRMRGYARHQGCHLSKATTR